MPFIEQSLKALKEMLKENGTMSVLGREGALRIAKCTFNTPLEETEITNFEKKMNLIFPEDYKCFLKEHNGARIFDIFLGDMNIGGALELFSLDEIESYRHLHQKTLRRELSFYPIGYLEGRYFVIDNNKIKQHNPNYLFLTDEALELTPLQLNFELFFDRFIISQGANFWQWPIYTAENYYRLR